MAINRKFKLFKGYGNKLNPIILDRELATDCLNVEAASNLALKKIDGITQKTTGKGSSLHLNYSKDEIFCLDTDGQRYNRATPAWSGITTDLTLPGTKKYRSVEVNGNTYLTPTDASDFVIKYNQESIMYSSAAFGEMPLGIVQFSHDTRNYVMANTLVGNTSYVCTLCQIDYTNNILNEYYESNGDTGYSFTMSTIAGNANGIIGLIDTSFTNTSYPSIGSGNKFTIDGDQAIADVHVEFTLTVKQSSVKVGDKLPICIESLPSTPGREKNAARSWLRVTTIVSPTSIKAIVEHPTNNDGIINAYTFKDNKVFTRYFMRVYRKLSTETSYNWISDTIFENNLAFLGTIDDGSAAYSSGPQTPVLELPFGSPKTKQVQPERFKDICYFQRMLFGCTDTTIYWSLQDDQVEYWNASRSQVFDNSEEGKVIAIRSIDDYLIIFKERAIYFGTGTFGDISGLRFWKSDLTDVGCSSSLSIQEINGSLLFLGQRGFYTITGGSVSSSKNTDVINNLIKDDTNGLQIQNAISCLWSIEDKYFCYIPATLAANCITLQYNFDADSWWIMNGRRFEDGCVAYLPKNTPISSDANAGVYFIDQSKALQKIVKDQLNDNGSAINAYYKTNWEFLGELAYEKKFLNMLMVNYKNRTDSITVKTEKDLVETVLDNSTRTMSKTLERQKIDYNLATAMRFTFENNVVNQDLALAGYEIEYETISGKMHK